jgi:hypothetical protein
MYRQIVNGGRHNCRPPHAVLPKPMSAVAIVSPGYPDSPGGVTDQTARLARHFEEHGTETTILASVEADVRSTTDGWVAKGVRAVLLQYVPFLYARRGVSRFPERVARFAKRRGIRVVTFVHEPWVPPTRLPWLVLSPLQRRQLRRRIRHRGSRRWQQHGRCSHDELAPAS